ncbi:uncharacterized protein LOC114782943 isoform X2 [Denticeps clupeoides]|uniref:uncharacterized protein LOC114782943 isoform X2 n=1 Tax=Denticeps clupeoides TaxID=299321 RepID=UPI0010A41FB9|nr:uncharacterized protein LOC114782943 isoform X2 [Denticeps clupeoides]
MGIMLGNYSFRNITKTIRSEEMGPRPDWLLYCVPGIAFILGIFLFALLLKKQPTKLGMHVVNSLSQTYEDKGSCCTVRQENRKKTGTCNPVKVFGTQSDENVREVIYANQQDLSYCDDCVPDEVSVADELNLKHTDFLHPPINLTDTDGESYENMEGSLYALPRKQDTQEDDGHF